MPLDDNYRIGLRSQSTGALARPSQAESQYKKQARNYDRANRLLGRAARRGDTKAALTQIGLQDQANASGFDVGGIRSHEGDIANTAGDIRRKEFIAGRNESTAARFAGGGVTPQAVRDAPATRFGETSGEAEAQANALPTFRAADYLGATGKEYVADAAAIGNKELLGKRQALDAELGQTLQKGGDHMLMASLAERAQDLGVKPELFDARAEARRKLLLSGGSRASRLSR